MIHVFRDSTAIALGIKDVFDFFSDASNLEKITPPELFFHILSPQPIHIAKGTLIDYRLRLFGIPFLWRTRIRKWDPPHCFVDEQIRGPYKMWIHTHRFQEQNGATLMQDEVQYRLPLWPAGEFAYPFLYLHLKRIFAFRKKAIQRLLPPAQ